ncbi:MAG: hypothetical protein JWR50_1107 [Mucilaginibacter sp.]|nr:hypothetical protein [Mucilaginibacter sp.]
MKNLIIQLFIAFTATAQRLVWKDPVFTYDKGFLQCERHWVIMPRADTSEAYPYGFLYMDREEGFIFQQAGVFNVDSQNKYLLDYASTKLTYPKKKLRWNGFMASITIWHFALIPEVHFKELKITQPEPDCVKPYYTYIDTLAYNYSRACIYGNSSYIYIMQLITY